MKVRVIMQNDFPKHVVHCENNEDIMQVELYCDDNTHDHPEELSGKRGEFWWSREFELLAPEDLEGLRELKKKLKDV